MAAPPLPHIRRISMGSDVSPRPFPTRSMARTTAARKSRGVSARRAYGPPSLISYITDHRRIWPWWSRADRF